MKSIIKAGMLGTALGVTALCGGSALADDASGVSFSGNIALTTDYVFRGISQSDNTVAVSGGFDATAGIFYAGTWASSVSFAPMEWDLYAGITPTLGAVSTDIGIIAYLYPSADDPGAEFDYEEGYVKASVSPTSASSLGASVYVSPNFFGETGMAYYIEGNGSFNLTDALSVSAAVGYQDIEDINGPAAGSPSVDYTTWNIGATYSIGGFDFDLRYTDTDIDAADLIVTSGFTSTYWSKGRAVFTISRAL